MTRPSIHLAPGLALPADAVTQTFAMLGKRGSGKTSTAVVLVEQLVRASLPVVVVDPVGVWWGLRFAADGKSPGLAVVVLGGEHGDVPLEETSGAVIADFVVDTSSPAALDLSLFSKGAVRRFMTDFAERLYRIKATRKQALQLVLDEADVFVPQRAEHGAERLVGAINDLVRRGRARGIGVTLISQRPALIAKDVLTQIEVLVALRLTGPQDRDAIERWIEHNADAVGAREVLASLASLDIGEAWVWSPGWLELFKRVRISKRTTFDSSATPKAGAVVVAPKNAAAVDLGALKERISATIEKAKAEDPRLLKARIAELERDATKAIAPAPERVEVPVITPDQLAAIGAIAERLEKVASEVGQWAGVMQSRRVLGAHDAVVGRTVPPFLKQLQTQPTTQPTHAPVHVARSQAVADDKQGRLGTGERVILRAIAQHRDGVTREQLTVLTGYKRSSRDTYLQRLRAAGVVEQNGETFEATEKGFELLGPAFEPLPTGGKLQEYWLERLPEGERRILDFVCRAFPTTVTRDELSLATGYKRSSRDTYIQRLSGRKLLVAAAQGEVRASGALFDGGR